MLRKVKLYGELAKFIEHKEFEVKVNNVAQAVSFLIHNFPEVERFMSPKYYQVKVGNYEIDENELEYPIGKEDIHFIPAISGAGRGMGKVLLGAALIGLAIAAPGAGFALGKGGFGFIATGGAAASPFMAAIGNIGVGLMLTGVSEMLFPLPEPQKFNSEEDPQLSFNFSGVQNTSRAGTPVPIVYGEIITGSVVISAAIDVNQVEA
jgi:predicted phage tail protein|tara:strand:+ start:251 stop:871 length:621 start_codon:yes stop_codon:yes gene_type:complete